MQNYNLKTFPNNIPIFPLPGALLLPESKLPLNIFEPRYLEMVEESLKSELRLIGMIQPQKKEKIEGDQSLYNIGCAGRISSFSETDDGRYLITLTGISRFELLEFERKENAYLKGKVNWDKFENDLVPQKPLKDFNRKEFLNTLRKYFESAQISSDWEILEHAEEDVLINSLSMLCPFDPEEKQVLLEAKTLFHRKNILLTLLNLFSEKGQRNEYIQ